MAHYQQLEFVRIAKEALPNYFSRSRVLEVGSWDVTGTIRNYFSDCDYIGADITSGPGIDLVCEGQDIDLPTNSVDIAVSCECFEHNSHWLETFVNMLRILKPGGLFLMTCAAPGRIEHGTTRRSAESSLTASFGVSDYYRNLGESDFARRLNLAGMFSCHGFITATYYNDLYFLGIKRGKHDEATACNAVRAALQKARGIGLKPGSRPSEIAKRLLLAQTARHLERALGSRIYHGLTLAAHRVKSRPILAR
jgi:SAM-dependent methyltransferase